MDTLPALSGVLSGWRVSTLRHPCDLGDPARGDPWHRLDFVAQEVPPGLGAV